MNINLGSLTLNEKKLLYIQNMRPAMKREALFSDETEGYRVPAEPDINEEVLIRFRTAKANVNSVYFCIDEEEYEMRLAGTDRIFDYYEYVYKLSDKQIHYYFKINSGIETCYYDKSGSCDVRTGWYDFTITPGFKTPDWAKGAVIYQIYTDRFFNGDKTNDVLTNEYSYIGDYSVRVDDWNKYPATMGVREFYGGDLQGVWDKLDYLQDLGIEVIYFNPMFVSPSNHKYDIQDYDYIDPHFGKIVEDGGELLKNGDKTNAHATKYIKRVADKVNLEASNEFFAKFVQEVHRRGMRVILDGVFNHCGSFNKWLDREQIYEKQEGYEKGAYVSDGSPYKNFFKFFENAWPYNFHYNGWWGHDTLPKLNYEESKELYDYILGIAKKWVSAPYNADGWRLDVAADLGQSSDFNHKFWKDFRKAVKEANPEAIILAEHYGDPGAWLQGDEWDTVMNYDAFMEPVGYFLTGMEKHSDAKRDDLRGNSYSFFAAMKHHMSRFQGSSLLVAMNELSNHDHSRFLTRTNGNVGRVANCGPQAAEMWVNKGIMKEAVVMQMTWPGAPTIYYGDEAGVCGWTDPDNRRTYPWGREDNELIDFHREAIRIHKENKALKKGSLKVLYGDYNILAYGRFKEENIMIVIVNNNEADREVKVPVWQLGLVDGDIVECLIESRKDDFVIDTGEIKIKDGRINMVVKGFSASIYRRKI